MEHFIPFVITYWYLWLGLIAVVVTIIFYETGVNLTGAKSISPQMVVSHLNRDKALVIDIRDNKSFTQGHIINAVHIVPSELSQKVKKIQKYKDKALIVACDNGSSSAAFTKQLRQHGFEHVFNLQGGMQAWQEAGLPVSKGKK